MSGESINPISDLVAKQLEQAKSAHHRCCIVFAGEQVWTRQSIDHCLPLFEKKSLAWVSNTAPENAETIDSDKIQNVLGDEHDAIIFDAYSGFNPDLFAAVSGTVRAGGCLFILVPALAEWRTYNDPEHERMTVHPIPAEEMTGRFLARVSRIISEDEQTLVIEQEKKLSAVKEFLNCDNQLEFDPPYKTNDQKLAVDAIKKVVQGHRRRPLVIISDRGRGKSSALGIAAAELMQTGLEQIIITAPRLDACKMAFTHVEKLLTDAKVKNNQIKTDTSSLNFYSPDELLQQKPTTKLLLVDEAAAIPSPVLEKLLRQYARVVFASTIHGYEGTGRGFTVRFHKKLDEITPSWQSLEMKSPIRWAENDPVEALIFKACLLNAKPCNEKKLENIKIEQCRLEEVDREKLFVDEKKLAKLFGLLINAHYQTKPADLRYMLDGPNLSIFTLQHKQKIVGTVLLAKEGGFDLTLAEAINSGKRRPHGHLVPEALAVHLGLKEAPLLKGGRIVRIAVHPSLQNKKLGTFLLEKIEESPSISDLDYLAASFGTTKNLLSFWTKSYYQSVRIGMQRNASSGEHSVVVMKPLTEQGKQLTQHARQRFLHHFPHQLSDLLCELETDLVAELFNEYRTVYTDQNKADLEDIEAFVDGQRIYESSIASIWKYSCMALMNKRTETLLDDTQRTVLIAKVIQKRSWLTTAELSGLTGRKAVMNELKSALGSLLEYDVAIRF